MPKASRANSKKAAPSSYKAAAALAQEQPLFEVDTVGNSTVRNQLAVDQQPASARQRKGVRKPLRSDLILAARSGVPALSSKVVPSADAQQKKVKAKLGNVDRKTKEKLKRIAGKDGQGEGLWGIKTGDQGEAVERVKDAGKYDAWEAQAMEDENADRGLLEALRENNPVTKTAPKVRFVLSFVHAFFAVLTRTTLHRPPLPFVTTLSSSPAPLPVPSPFPIPELPTTPLNKTTKPFSPPPLSPTPPPKLATTADSSSRRLSTPREHFLAALRRGRHTLRRSEVEKRTVTEGSLTPRRRRSRTC
jgi:hypothetical protein